MTTIVNNPPVAEESSGGSSTFMLGIVMLIVFVAAALYFGLPMIRNTAQQGTPPTQIINEAPAQNAPQPQTQPDTQINVPDKIDVNVNQEEPAQQ